MHDGKSHHYIKFPFLLKYNYILNTLRASKANRAGFKFYLHQLPNLFIPYILCCYERSNNYMRNIVQIRIETEKSFSHSG